jgi:hypothetical protein
MSLTASPHNAGHLITRIRAKQRFLTPTYEKSWQSLLLGREGISLILKEHLYQKINEKEHRHFPLI